MTTINSCLPGYTSFGIFTMIVRSGGTSYSKAIDNIRILHHAHSGPKLLALLPTISEGMVFEGHQCLRCKALYRRSSQHGFPQAMIHHWSTIQPLQKLRIHFRRHRNHRLSGFDAFNEAVIASGGCDLPLA